MENSEVHICKRKMERSAYVNEYKKMFKVLAISQTEHTPESFILVKRMLCKAATTNVNLKFHGISQTAVVSVSVHCPIIL